MSTDISFILDSLLSSASVEVQVFIILFYGFVVCFCIYGAKGIHTNWGNIDYKNLTTIGFIDLRVNLSLFNFVLFNWRPSSFFSDILFKIKKICIWKLYYCLALSPHRYDAENFQLAGNDFLIYLFLSKLTLIQINIFEITHLFPPDILFCLILDVVGMGAHASSSSWYLYLVQFIL